MPELDWKPTSVIDITSSRSTQFAAVRHRLGLDDRSVPIAASSPLGKRTLHQGSAVICRLALGISAIVGADMISCPISA